jgi:hypothetical protein
MTGIRVTMMDKCFAVYITAGDSPTLYSGKPPHPSLSPEGRGMGEGAEIRLSP